jgi:hypothetical protein
MNFPDLPHLQQLQRDLWKWPKSRAALMIGAGFSLNASPLAGVTSRFPTWRELVRAMFDQLHPTMPNESGTEKVAREEKFNRANPLRIASEYEAALGRDKLERIIRDQNPDSDFQPGPLHQLLLELPWADVFTTNYDTLLERTEIPGRNYQTVIKADELPTSFSPRIVKLHGSFPSQTPFIISEEDYRTYPRRFSPFVNTVQQALLENAFVLLGFSGDDPNFIAWTGWIRDELGENHAPIYLVGPLSLGNAERQLLQRRGVTPIDLTPVFHATARNQVHQTSIEWFLKCLAAAKPPRPDRWPEFLERPVAVPANFPPLVGVAEKIPEDIPIAPDHQHPLTNELASKAVKRWQFERQRYPGWILLPHQKRKPLWNETQYWIGPLLDHAKDWPVAERLILFREINWRLETAMAPLFGNTVEQFEKATNEAFLQLSAGNIPSSPGGILSGVAVSDSDVLTSWMELMCGLLREAREMYNEPRWQNLKAQLDSVISRHPEFEDQSHYETALWAMWNVRREEAKVQVARWQPLPRSPLASLKKAGLLAELDELGESRTILRTALLDVRRALRTHGQNIHLLSLEGWITYLLFAVEQARDFGKRTAIREEFWERWQELKAWDCSPWEQKAFFEQELAGEPPTVGAEGRELIGFDPGHVSISKTYSGNLEAFLPAFACIRAFEQAGIPFRMPLITMLGDALQKACDWIAPFIGLWSPALLVRAGNVSGLTQNSLFLTRTSIAAMPPEIAHRLHTWCLNIFEKEIVSIGSAIGHHSAQESILKVLPEVISRLAFRVPEPDLRRSFSAALKFHNLPAVRSHFSMHEVCAPWFKRLFDAAEDVLLLEWLPELLRAPLPLFDGHQTPHQREEGISPDLMNKYPGGRAAKARSEHPDLVTKASMAVDWLLSRAQSETGIAWRRAMIRLLNVSSNNLLTEEQNKILGEQVWSRRGANGLPELTNLTASGYILRFVPPAGVDAKAILKRYVLSLKPAVASIGPDGQKVIGVTYGWKQRFVHEAIVVSKPIISFHGETLRGVEWTPDEANELYETAHSWLEKDKSLIQTKEQREGDPVFGRNPVLSEAQDLDDYLRLAVLPWISWSEDAIWQRFFAWLDELRNLGVYLTAAYPYILLHRPAEAGRFSQIIAADLDSTVDDAIRAAAEALRDWSHLKTQKGIPMVEHTAVENLIKRILFRRKEKLEYCLSVLSHLIFEKPELFTLDQINLLIASLEPWNSSTILPNTTESSGEFPEPRRPLLRQLLGELAGALKRWFAKSGQTPPTAGPLATWESLCAVDPLPEIRRSFNKWNDVSA